MAPPVINAVAPNPAEPRQQILVTGTHFGFVSDAFFEDEDGNLKRATFTQVFDGEHALVTVPPDITTGEDYTLVLTTIEDEISVNNFGLLTIQPISGVVTPIAPPETPDPYPLPVEGESNVLDRLRARTRLELADPKTPFQAQVVGDGNTTRFNLPVRHVQATGLVVTRIPKDADADDAVTLNANTDFVIDPFNGEIVLTAPLADGDNLYVTGWRHRFFEDEVLDQFIHDAFVQISHGRRQVTTNISAYGYRTFTEWAMQFDTLPEIEILPTAILAKTFALWVLATDASYDIDVGADGASIPRTERYRQLLGQIQQETARFNDIAQALNIGIHRIEISTLRRISRTTGRLVPVYVPKEYDDRSLPVRVLPGVDHGVGEGTEFVDPYYQAGAGYGGGFGP